MAITDARLNLITFPQRWDGARLHFRVLALPKGNPRLPLFAGAPAFAASKLKLRARIVASLDTMPDPGGALPAGAHFAETPDGIGDVFEALAATLAIDPGRGGNPHPVNTKFKKYLTRSYRDAFAFDGPSRDFVFIDDAYECALKNPATTNRPPRRPPSGDLSWGQALSYAIRQPRVAAALGLLFEGDVALSAPNPFEAGGWLYADLDPAGGLAAAFAAQPAMLATFAARIPPLELPRSLFAGVSFPVVTGASGPFDEQLVEAEKYDDGFAKIVHGSQPEHGAILETEKNPSPAVRDIGIRLGCDDEQIAVWLNRQIDPATVTPMGVAGYRLDVRRPGTVKWHSLVRAAGGVKLGGLELGIFDGEFAVEAMAQQLMGQPTGDYWLPQYLTTWGGASLVIRSETALKLAKRDEAVAARVFAVPNDHEIPALRYGKTYEFRVRLVDLSRGGPGADDSAVNPAPAPHATIRFRRYAPPKGVVLEHHPAQLPDGPISRFRVARPRLGYPDAVFADVPNAEHLLLADLAVAGPAERETGVPDPDVVAVEITVEVLLPGGSESRDESRQFFPIYTTVRTFDYDPNSALDLEVAYLDLRNLATLQAADPLQALPGDGPIRVPSARRTRLRLVAVCKADPGLDYFGSERVRRSAVPVFVELEAPSEDERGLFVARTAGEQIRAFFLQPDPPGEPSRAAERLARHLSLGINGLILTGAPGRRTVFACAGALRHTLSPDHSSISFASASDLLRQWIVAIRLQIDRDWTWDALAAPGLAVERDGHEIGVIEWPRAISELALSGDRTSTDLVFFHAIDPKPAPGQHPAEIHTRYAVKSHWRRPPLYEDPPLEWPLRLPVAVAPTQTPRLVSGGLAFSEYESAADYSSTRPRRQKLWLEFDSPPVDPQDGYFIRVLARAPDPLLMRDDESIAEPAEPPLGLDPEWIRAIIPEQSADTSGRDEMQRLLPPPSGAPGAATRVLVPLPEGLGPESLELFGFFVCELRVGHDDSRWSLAQARFGPPLRVTGVQHPMPSLSCHVGRNGDEIRVDAPYATPLLEGRNLRPTVPNTEIWALLYAQVVQVDGAAHRNVLIARAQGRPLWDQSGRDRLHGDNLRLLAAARFPQGAVSERLAALGLPRNSPLSIVAVEMLPEPEVQRFGDPLGGDLGRVRILRASPLQAVPQVC